ncbi:MAG: response regulator [bacterium]
MRRILVIDDNDTFLEIMKDTLGKCGYEVITAGDGPEALSLVREQSFDAILLDLLLPRMTGFDVLQEMRSMEGTSQTPILAVSGVFRQDSQIQYLREVGATGFVSKEQTPKEIADRVDRLFQPLSSDDSELAAAKADLPGLRRASFEDRGSVDSMPLFLGLAEDQIEKIVSESKRRKFPAGEVIIREGEQGDHFYGILSGTVVVEKGADQAVLARLGPGEEFGELALVDREVRVATCRAETEVEALEIERTEFEKVLEDDPELERKLLRSLLAILARRLRQTDTSLTFSRTLLDKTLEA